MRSKDDPLRARSTAPAAPARHIDWEGDRPPARELRTLVVVLLSIGAGVLAAAIVLPMWLPGLSDSLRGPEPKVFWYLSRASALVAYGLLWLSMLCGLLLSNRLAQVWPGGRAAFEVHQHASLLGLGFALFHALILLGDRYIEATPAHILVPFGYTSYATVWVGLGQIGLYGLAAIGLSFYVKPWIGRRLWRAVHFLSFAVFLLALMHGIASGSEGEAGRATHHHEQPGAEQVHHDRPHQPAAEKAVVRLDPLQVNLPMIREAVERAGYLVPNAEIDQSPPSRLVDITRPILTLFGVVFGVVLFVVVVGEWLGLFEAITERVPWPLGLAVVLVAGYPVFRNVVRAALKRQVIAHTLMTVGVLAALLVGEWATAVVVVFFMRVGDYAERFTAERARRAVKDLTALAPRIARVERDGMEVELPIDAVHPDDIVVVRPGEQIPVDGAVLSGQATVNQAAITGESMPVEVGSGASVFAATLILLGSVRVRTTHVGADTTFGRVIKLVEEAESQRADVQRVADRFSAYYLPVVASIAALTFLLRRDPLATAAVLVVACSCSFALATPIAMLASIGAGARRGLLIKGGKYLEALARADVLLVDKTGTLTLGRPHIADIIALNGMPADEVLELAAAAERYSEHPLAEAVRQAAGERGLALAAPEQFESVPGMGVRAQVHGQRIAVGNRRMIAGQAGRMDELERQGKTLLVVARKTRSVAQISAMALRLSLQSARAIATFFSLLSAGDRGSPPLLPRARAAASPAWVCSRMMSRSSAASAPKTWRIRFPRSSSCRCSAGDSLIRCRAGEQ